MREFTKIRTYEMRAKRKPNFSNAFTCELYVVKKLDATFRVSRRAFTIFGKAIHNPLTHGVKRIITHYKVPSDLIKLQKILLRGIFSVLGYLVGHLNCMMPKFTRQL